MSASSIEALIPEMPAPTTTEVFTVSISIDLRSLNLRAFSIPAITNLIALRVASAGLSECAQELCSLILTWI